MEVLLGSKDQSLMSRDALDLVCPLPGNLDSGLDGLRAGVHGESHVVAEHGVDLFGPLGEHIVVEGAGAEGEPAGLLGEGLDELGVAVALVDSTVGGEEIDVVLALGVPDVDARGLGEDDGERVVVVCSKFVLRLDGALCGRGVESRVGGSAVASRGGVCVGCHGCVRLRLVVVLYLVGVGRGSLMDWQCGRSLEEEQDEELGEEMRRGISARLDTRRHDTKGRARVVSSY